MSAVLAHDLRLHKLLYLSKAAQLFDDPAIDAIRDIAQRNNQAIGISGYMLYCHPFFIQTLEGPLCVLRTLYAKLQYDTRHSSLLVLRCHPIAERQFGGWSMNVMSLKYLANMHVTSVISDLTKFVISGFQMLPDVVISQLHGNLSLSTLTPIFSIVAFIVVQPLVMEEASQSFPFTSCKGEEDGVFDRAGEMSDSALAHALTLITSLVRSRERPGLVLKFTGSGVLVMYPPASAVSALLTFAAIVRRAADTGSFGVRIGASMGPTLVGNVGQATRRDSSVIADSVNRAARLVSHASSFLPVMFDDAVYGKVARDPQADTLPPIRSVGRLRLKGKEHALDVYGLQSAAFDGLDAFNATGVELLSHRQSAGESFHSDMSSMSHTSLRVGGLLRLPALDHKPVLRDDLRTFAKVPKSPLRPPPLQQNTASAFEASADSTDMSTFPGATKPSASFMAEIHNKPTAAMLNVLYPTEVLSALRESSDFVRLHYISLAVVPFSEEELQFLATSAAQVNAKHGITGALLKLGDYFFQFLEGRACDVLALMDRIGQDPRHVSVSILTIDTTARKRQFGEWNMRWIPVRDEDSPEWLPLRDFLRVAGAFSSALSAFLPTPVSMNCILGYNPEELSLQQHKLVLFTSDMLQFTRIIESASTATATELVTFIATAAVSSVEAYGGVVHSFGGDAISAYFPGTPDGAAGAVAAAQCLMNELEEFRKGHPRNSLLHYTFMSVGLHFGPVRVGVLRNANDTGASQFTLLGANVIKAQQIESLSRFVDSCLVVSNDLYHIMPLSTKEMFSKPTFVRGNDVAWLLDSPAVTLYHAGLPSADNLGDSIDQRSSSSDQPFVFSAKSESGTFVPRPTRPATPRFPCAPPTLKQMRNSSFSCSAFAQHSTGQTGSLSQTESFTKDVKFECPPVLPGKANAPLKPRRSELDFREPCVCYTNLSSALSQFPVPPHVRGLSNHKIVFPLPPFVSPSPFNDDPFQKRTRDPFTLQEHIAVSPGAQLLTNPTAWLIECVSTGLKSRTLV